VPICVPVVFDASLSGLTAASVLYDVTADNVANAANPAYAARQAVLTSQLGLGGVAVSGIQTAPVPGVDLGVEMANLIIAGDLYGANARTISVQDEMLGSLFDALA